jgi:Family of unknown function (DUF6527)
MKTNPKRRRERRLKHLFVEFIPEDLKEGVIYISMVYATASHLCCCGCGQKVVTAFSPADWQLTFDGRSISLRPSIGNWNFPCRSHYWITGSTVHWAPSWSEEQVADSRSQDLSITSERLVEKSRAARARNWLASILSLLST